MLEAFQTHINKEFPELFTASIALAISGGKDSTVLAHLLNQSGIQFDFIHCNFTLRGIESDGDQQFVAHLADQFNSNFHVKSFDTESFAIENSISIQMAARELRYRLFDKIAAKHNYDHILVAHHLEDQLETFLIHLGRGAGLHGLTGIRSRNGKITRPLLPFSRDQLDDYAAKNSIKWREDSSNRSTKYLRNKLRHDVIPSLYDALPHLKNNFSKSLEYLKDAESLVDVEVFRFRESGTKTIHKTLEISVEQLKATENPGAYLYELLKDYSFNLIDALGLLDAENGKRIYSKKMQLTKDREVLVLSEMILLDKINIKINQLNGKITAGDVVLGVKTIETSNPLGYLESNRNSNKLFIDARELQLPLILRNWEHGDRMQPYGMKGSKLISDMLTDSKISSQKREKALVLTSGNDIIWLLGKRASKHHPITSTTNTIIELTIEL